MHVTAGAVATASATSTATKQWHEHTVRARSMHARGSMRARARGTHREFSLSPGSTSAGGSVMILTANCWPLLRSVASFTMAKPPVPSVLPRRYASLTLASVRRLEGLRPACKRAKSCSKLPACLDLQQALHACRPHSCL